jgi:L-ascorbate metabolism protein UlaG (beta-lactamase superfamily)
MGPREAARDTGLLGVEDVVPIHYGTFPLWPAHRRGFGTASTAGLGVRIHAPSRADSDVGSRAGSDVGQTTIVASCRR